MIYFKGSEARLPFLGISNLIIPNFMGGAHPPAPTFANLQTMHHGNHPFIGEVVGGSGGV